MVYIWLKKKSGKKCFKISRKSLIFPPFPRAKFIKVILLAIKDTWKHDWKYHCVQEITIQGFSVCKNSWWMFCCPVLKKLDFFKIMRMFRLFLFLNDIVYNLKQFFKHLCFNKPLYLHYLLNIQNSKNIVKTISGKVFLHENNRQMF